MLWGIDTNNGGAWVRGTIEIPDDIWATYQSLPGRDKANYLRDATGDLRLFNQRIIVIYGINEDGWG